jgi:hypothetical protein
VEDEQDSEHRGPIEHHRWPDKLQAWVWSAGPRPRVHGYDLQDDIARHFGFAELTLTSLRGHAPTPAEGSLFEAVMLFLAPAFVSESPAHAAVVARTCDSRWPAVMACGSAVLAEQAHAIVEQHAELLSWLEHPEQPFPGFARCRDDEEREAVARFAARVRQSSLSVPALDHAPTLLAAILAAAHRCGLEDVEHLSALVVIARLPAVLCEALRPPGNLRAYPIDTPHVTYRADPEEDGTQ